MMGLSDGEEAVLHKMASGLPPWPCRRPVPLRRVPLPGGRLINGGQVDPLRRLRALLGISTEGGRGSRVGIT